MKGINIKKLLILGLVLGLLGCIWGISIAGSATKTISSAPGASGTFTDAISPTYAEGDGSIVLEIRGTWVGTVYLQRRQTSSGTWADVRSFTSNTVRGWTDSIQQGQYRVGMKQGGYTSGSCIVTLYTKSL